MRHEDGRVRLQEGQQFVEAVDDYEVPRAARVLVRHEAAGLAEALKGDEAHWVRERRDLLGGGGAAVEFGDLRVVLRVQRCDKPLLPHAEYAAAEQEDKHASPNGRDKRNEELPKRV